MSGKGRRAAHAAGPCSQARADGAYRANLGPKFKGLAG